MRAAVVLRAAVFDLDDTLLDFRRMKLLGSHAALRAMVRSGADFGVPDRDAGDMLFGAYMEDPEGDRVFERFLQRHHRPQGGLRQHDVDRITAAAVNAYLQAKWLHLQPYAGVPRTLVELARRGLRMGVVTAAPRFKAYQRLDTAGLTHFFDFVVTGEDAGGEARTRLFRDAVERLGVPATEVLAVGTWDAVGLDTAHALGLKTAWAAYGKPDMDPPGVARQVLRTFRDVVQVVALSG